MKFEKVYLKAQKRLLLDKHPRAPAEQVRSRRFCDYPFRLRQLTGCQPPISLEVFLFVVFVAESTRKVATGDYGCVYFTFFFHPVDVYITDLWARVLGWISIVDAFFSET